MGGALLITPGEPGGIGPDIVCHIAQQSLPFPICAVANAAMLQERAHTLGLRLNLQHCTVDDIPAIPSPAGTLNVISVPLDSPAEPGSAKPEHGAYVLRSLDIATDACLAGSGAALVTGPINKASIIDAGFSTFTGHTEYLAERCNVERVVMMLASDTLRVALATTHLPLSQVSAAITKESLEQTLRILHSDLAHRFAIEQPEISVCGLNPHAGEQGHLGAEEINTIEPVCEKLRSEGMLVNGPLPADTAFTPRALDGVHAVLAMYHDQGLPVIKHADFGSTVNITLGLPIIRTSVDHGTALDIAGSGTADESSLKAALQCAQRLVDGQTLTQTQRNAHG